MARRMSVRVSRRRLKSATVAAFKTVLHVRGSRGGFNRPAASLYCFSAVLIAPERVRNALLILSRSL